MCIAMVRLDAGLHTLILQYIVGSLVHQLCAICIAMQIYQVLQGSLTYVRHATHVFDGNCVIGDVHGTG